METPGSVAVTPLFRESRRQELSLALSEFLTLTCRLTTGSIQMRMSSVEANGD